MSRRVGDYYIIEEEPHAPCEMCGRVADLRPYGPNRERICGGCAERNPEATKRKIAEQMEGVKGVFVGERMYAEWLRRKAEKN